MKHGRGLLPLSACKMYGLALSFAVYLFNDCNMFVFYFLLSNILNGKKNINTIGSL